MLIAYVFVHSYLISPSSYKFNSIFPIQLVLQIEHGSQEINFL